MLEAPDNDDDEFASRNHTVGLTYSINSDMIIDDNLSEDDIAKLLTKAWPVEINHWASDL